MKAVVVEEPEKYVNGPDGKNRSAARPGFQSIYRVGA